jgi:hypothetical protein
MKNASRDLQWLRYKAQTCPGAAPPSFDQIFTLLHHYKPSDLQTTPYQQPIISNCSVYPEPTPAISRANPQRSLCTSISLGKPSAFQLPETSPRFVYALRKRQNTSAATAANISSHTKTL